MQSCTKRSFLNPTERLTASQGLKRQLDEQFQRPLAPPRGIDLPLYLQARRAPLMSRAERRAKEGR